MWSNFVHCKVQWRSNKNVLKSALCSSYIWKGDFYIVLRNPRLFFLFGTMNLIICCRGLFFLHMQNVWLDKIIAFRAFISDNTQGYRSLLWKWNLSLQVANHWYFINQMNEPRCKKVTSKKSVVFALERFVKMLDLPSTQYALCGLFGGKYLKADRFSSVTQLTSCFPLEVL